jgi:hypothetical protein
MCFGLGKSDTYYHEEVKPARPHSHYTHHWHHTHHSHGHHHGGGHHHHHHSSSSPHRSSHHHHHHHHGSHHHHHHGSHASLYSPRTSYVSVASGSPHRSGSQVVYATREREAYTY